MDLPFQNRGLGDLVSHDSHFRKQSSRRYVTKTLYDHFLDVFADTSLASTSFDELFHLDNVVRVNGFSIAFTVYPTNSDPIRPLRNGGVISLGVSIYLNASRFDHSCRPSLVFNFEGCRLIAKKVPKTASDTQRSIERRRCTSDDEERIQVADLQLRFFGNLRRTANI